MTPHPKSTDLEVTSIWGQPFPDSIKEAAELRETEDKNGGAESLTASTMTTTVSESSPVFSRGQPLKIWEPHSQLHTAEGKSRPLTGLQAEAKNAYKQLAMLTNNKGRNCQGHSLVFQLVKKWSHIKWGAAMRCIIILEYQNKSERIQNMQSVGWISRSWSAAPIGRMFSSWPPLTVYQLCLHSSPAQHTGSEAIR